VIVRAERLPPVHRSPPAFAARNPRGFFTSPAFRDAPERDWSDVMAVRQDEHLYAAKRYGRYRVICESEPEAAAKPAAAHVA
jgi:ribosomal protein L36